MKWLLQRILAGLAAIAVVATGAGALLGMQYSGDPAPWAASTGDDAAWLGNAWVNGDRDERDVAALLPRLREAGFADLYVHAGDIGPEGTVDPAGYAAADRFLGALRRELPETRVLGWLSSTASGSSLVADRIDPAGRAALAAAAGDMVDAGFDGVHYAVYPVSSNDPTLPDLLERTREEAGPDAVLSVDAQQVELIPGLRLPVHLVARGERYWSVGYLRRVAEQADQVVIRGHGTGMPIESLYGGFMVRQAELGLEAVPEEVTLRFGVPSYDHEGWGEASSAESVATAARAVRLGLTGSGERRESVGMAVYVLDDTSEENWEAFRDGWLAPGR
ncbi:hypothetical protein [Marinitenerispora sediminis]|uniref:Uncharacterized protein n=1 Tax=Marinitenerispora sediminis TaxID=1931232 RepID=A0A368T1U7_9ACTN|nr:hypothetical protein [Marinitenerispora sediminis]RCV50578.1 hypothetical protein DEF28_17790 [Marinitenerispora sediminis]RCV54625.1 hypothetical protein DEF24_19025 [Marinitenerispora sediminis]RCV54914.1 hypothetical protein DEF23_15190 [Marinitenerispora sediminis]